VLQSQQNEYNQFAPARLSSTAARQLKEPKHP